MFARTALITSNPLTVWWEKIKFPYLYFPLHGDDCDDTSTEIVELGYNTGNGQNSPIMPSRLNAIIGSTTNVWSTRRGWFSPNSAGSYLAIQQKADNLPVMAFHRLSDLTAGGFLLCFRLRFSSNPTASEWIYGIARTSGYGGFGVVLLSSGRLQVIVRDTTPATTVLYNPVIATNTDLDVVLYLDCKTLVPQLWINGVQQSANNNIPSNLPTLPGNFYGWWGLAVDSDDGASDWLNAYGSSAQIKDVLAVRCTSDIAADVSQIAAAWNDKTLYFDPRDVGLG